jgi:hypothetical protein
MEMSEWMRVMLEEIERKHAEAAEAREELERRRAAADGSLPREGDGPTREA